MDPAELIVTARSIAARHVIDPALVCAVIEQESAWEPYAIRYEPAFRVRYVAPLNLHPTEEIARSISWGLMQVMGQVAREQNFAGDSLASICKPEVGLEIGCRVLAQKLSYASDNLPRALLLWNGGANPAYASEVLARLSKYR